ncbi:MAG TPA: hypothetical protein VFT55_04780 [Planctomycetota bacterium]|nr:hypothetical protein [Planctomycetota bacterium]
MRSMSFIRVVLPLVLAVLCPLLRGQQSGAETGATPQAPATLDATTMQALDRLAILLENKRNQLRTALDENDLKTAASLETELKDLGWQFAGLTSRMDVQEFEAPQSRQFDINQQFEELIRPLLQTIKDATEEPRQVADLKARIGVLEQRQRIVLDAMRNVERTRSALPADSKARAEAEVELARRWKPALEALTGEILVLRAQLLARAEGQKSLVESITAAAQAFVQSSGLSLLLAVAVFTGLYVGLSYVLNRLLRGPLTGAGFSLRLMAVVLKIMSLLIAIAGTLVVPYVRNDWLLLALCMVFLLGVGWVLVRMMPQFFEQIRLVLNVGGVREGERIVVDGVPFRVESLRFYSKLHNPELEGGVLRMPIQDLIGRRSRRSGPDEPWFPCRKGDVVLLADGVMGPVLTQTPDVVVVEHFGSPRSYPSASFLQQQPRNLSRGFVVSTTLGIDYSHQAEATTAIPARMQEAVQQGLAAGVAAGELLEVRADLLTAANSKLEYVVLARFAGSAAMNYFDLQRRMQSLLVAACTQNGWRIPYPQLTLQRPAS